MTPVPLFTFNNGVKVPACGLGCWMGDIATASKGAEETEAMVKTALKHGYRHFDTAGAYGTEEALGKAIRESGIPREEIFVTTKVFRQTSVDTKAAFELSLKTLGLDYIDLWLLHSPIGLKEPGQVLTPEESPTYLDTWKEMEQVYELAEGRVKAIGVSNFSIKTLDVLLAEAKIVPVTNQVILHPAYPQNELLEYCKGKSILLTAWSPLGNKYSPFFDDPVLQDVAKKEGGTVAQAIVSWNIQRGIIVIPKSEKEDRIRSNIQLLSMSDESMKTIGNWHKEPGMHKPLLGSFYSTPGTIMGWTYEQLGWDMRWDEAKKEIVAI